VNLSFDQLRLVEPLARFLEDAPIADAHGSTIGWHSSVVGSNEAALGSGFHAERSVAQRIAVAEVIERGLYRRISSDPALSSQFLTEEFPSSCGFAAGFDGPSTRWRAVAEALERWAWSKWIDEGYLIPSLSQHIKTTRPLRDHILMKFDSYRIFERELKLEGGLGLPTDFKLTIILAFKDGGAFPGSRVSAIHEDATEHAAIEAWRHWIIYKGLPRVDPGDLVNGRIHYFGNNAKAAEELIAQGRRNEWPQPRLRILKSMAVELGRGLRVSLSRALCSDYSGWHEGDVHRFVY
jgi:hypothetical protein